MPVTNPAVRPLEYVSLAERRRTGSQPAAELPDQQPDAAASASSQAPQLTAEQLAAAYEAPPKAAAPAPKLLGRGGLTDEEVLMMPAWQPAV